MVKRAETTTYFEKGHIIHHDLSNSDDLQPLVTKLSKDLIPIILKFYSDTCPPCKIISSALEDYYYKKVHLISINCSKSSNRNIITKYNITAIPAFIIIDLELNVKKKANFADKEKFVEFVDLAYEQLKK